MTLLRSFALVAATFILPACRKPDLEKLDSQEVSSPATIIPTATKKAPIAESAQVASLIDPAKLATLKDRGANPRIMKIMAILYTMKTSGKSPEDIVAGAIEKIGWSETENGKLTAAAIIRNLDILEKVGSTTPEDIDAMRRGRSPTVRRGPYSGDCLRREP